MVSRLQSKAEQIGKILNNLEKYNHLLNQDSDIKNLKSPTGDIKSPSGELKPSKNDSHFSESGKKKPEDGQPPVKKLDLKEIPPFRFKNRNPEESTH